ncbi:hypothetical protein [Rhizobium metallidurans]|uniref:Transmembrane protein n=1 Tax=Rhizobium metallidurans TaxID=1265931 RepID=A0A7W6GC09_9HYPH|nr:hypothetical protein [Rhizobium metallidurans]MBB3966278.1 hypothetical protein [Rhizobium metallidurans]
MREREKFPVLLQIYILALLISLSGMGVSALSYWFGWPFALPVAVGSGFLLIVALLMAEYVNFPGSSLGKKLPEQEK